MQKNITFSADERLIRKARAKARRHNQSLNVVFRQWLCGYASDNEEAIEYLALMEQLKHVKPGRKFSRDEMNER